MIKDNIKWYPYPQEKPRYGGDYSVYLIDKGEIYESVSVWIPQLNMFSAEAGTIVVAWADSDQPSLVASLVSCSPVVSCSNHTRKNCD